MKPSQNELDNTAIVLAEYKSVAELASTPWEFVAANYFSVIPIRTQMQREHFFLIQAHIDSLRTHNAQNNDFSWSSIFKRKFCYNFNTSYITILFRPKKTNTALSTNQLHT